MIHILNFLLRVSELKSSLLRPLITQNSKTQLIQTNWDGEPFGYAENPDNWIFFLKIDYIGSLKFGCYYLQYVLAFEPFNHFWFVVLEAITLYCTWSDNR
jgi:hypothetical protein